MSVCTKQQRLAELARQSPQMTFASFDALDKGHLRTMLDRRVRDGVVRRLIGKWLSAGVLEAGEVWYPQTATPQGGVISPLPSNLYRHDVLDTWFERDVRPRLRGRAFLIRHADDFVMGFEREDDARRVLAVLPQRFARFGLTIHPEKTRLLEFYPPAQATRQGHSPAHAAPAGWSAALGRLSYVQRGVYPLPLCTGGHGVFTL